MALSLKISIVDRCVVKTMKFDPSTTVFDACRMIREKIGDIVEKECKLIGDHCLHLVVLSFNMCFFFTSHFFIK